MVKQRAVFRVDSSLEIGTGHVMRCLTLAEVLKERGVECYFICREHTGNLIDTIGNYRYPVFRLPSGQNDYGYPVVNDKVNHGDWLGTSQEDDARKCTLILEKLRPNWIIVDHYALSKEWETKIKQFCLKLLVIDDLADRSHDCDLLVDQNLGRQRNDYGQLVSRDCVLFLGSGYALLRPEFAYHREKSLARRLTSPNIRKILISMGGVDQYNSTGAVLTALNKAQLPKDISIVVVMGAKAPHLSEVQAQARCMDLLTDVKINVSNMAELMAASDIAIGAAGSTSWERCCLGVPTLMMILAENQIFIANQLHESGAAISVGSYYGNNISGHQAITSSLEYLINNSEALSTMSMKAARLVDGNGAKRIVSNLLN